MDDCAAFHIGDRVALRGYWQDSSKAEDNLSRDFCFGPRSRFAIGTVAGIDNGILHIQWDDPSMLDRDNLITTAWSPGWFAPYVEFHTTEDIENYLNGRNRESDQVSR